MNNTLYRNQVYNWIDSYDRDQPLTMKSVLLIVGDVWISKELHNRYNVVLEIDFENKNTYDLLIKTHSHTLQLFDTRPSVIYIDNVALLDKKCENDLLRVLRSGKIYHKSIPIVINVLFLENIGNAFRDECCMMEMKVDVSDRNDLLCRNMDRLCLELQHIDEGDKDGCGDEDWDEDDHLTLEEYKRRLEDIIFS